MTPEGKVKEKIKELLKKHNVWYFMPRGTALGRSGIPDFVCCYAGWFLAIEAKAEGGKATALQAKELAEIAMAGGISLLIFESNLGELEEMLELLPKHHPSRVSKIVNAEGVPYDVATQILLGKEGNDA